MQAIEFSGSNKTLLLIKKPTIPEIKEDDQVLIKVAYAGICGTDLHIIQGEFPAKEDGVILGHEFSGTVVDVGSAVTQFKVGDRVVVDPTIGCRICDLCHSGEYHFCPTGLQNTLGIYRNGGWAEYCLVPDYQITKLPSDITLAQAALCEPLSCLAHTLDKIAPIPVGKSILIIGAGIIGNLWVICLHLQGHRKVTISEPNEFRRKQLSKLETGFASISPEELQIKQNQGTTYDFIIDCSGFGPAIENAIDLLNFGGKLCIFGVAALHTVIKVSPYKLFERELSIIGTRKNPFSFPNAIGLLESLGNRYLNYDNLGIEIFSLEEYKTALEKLKQGKIAKAIFKL